MSVVFVSKDEVDGISHSIISTGLEMLIKQREQRRWRSRSVIQRKTIGHIVGITLLLFSPSAHAIGPYNSESSTVLDQGTGLEWQKSNNTSPHTWQDALSYCENLSLDAKTDWRLPNIRELKSLVDYSRYYPAIDPVVSCQSANYWSATSLADGTHVSAWSVFFGNGDDIWKIKTEKHHVRCVRDGVPEQ